MKQIDLSQLIKKYGEKKIYEKESFLFKNGDIDSNIYFIQDGLISLQKKGEDIFRLGNGQIFGEKTFITGQKRPLDAKIEVKSTIYSFPKDSFQKLDIEEQNAFLSKLVVYLSDRVNSLDSILAFLSNFNDILIDYDVQSNEKMLNFVQHFFEINSYIILKSFKNSFQLLYGNMSFDDEIEKFITTMINEQVDIRMGKNYLFIHSGAFVFLFMGKPKIDEYISDNMLFYGRALIQFLGESIESSKNSDLQKICDI